MSDALPLPGELRYRLRLAVIPWLGCHAVLWRACG
jgi:hypothetical protein